MRLNQQSKIEHKHRKLNMTTHEIIEQLARMECINYNHYSAPRLCTKAARDRLEELQREKVLLAEAVCSGNSIHAEKLVQERDEARAEVERLQGVVEAGLEKQKMLRAEVERLKLEPKTIIQQVTTRPEPSRLEIAAQLLCVYVAENKLNSFECVDEALVQADALIAAARKGGK
jgi:hypothetical protein